VVLQILCDTNAKSLAIKLRLLSWHNRLPQKQYNMLKKPLNFAKRYHNSIMIKNVGHTLGYTGDFSPCCHCLKGAQSWYFELFLPCTKLPFNRRNPENNSLLR